MSLVLALAFVAGVAKNAEAAVIVDPDDNDSGVILSISGTVFLYSTESANTGGDFDTIYLTATQASTMDVKLQATYWATPDLALGLVLDIGTEAETALAATSTSNDGEKFSAFYDDVPLTTGEHTLTVQQTDGAGLATYHITVTADAPSAVPEPATMTLMATGLLGLVAMRRRRQSKRQNTPVREG